MMKVIVGMAFFALAAGACVDDNPGVIKAAKDEGESITGCSDVTDYCYDGQYGPLVRKLCPKSCRVCIPPLTDAKIKVAVAAAKKKVGGTAAQDVANLATAAADTVTTSTRNKLQTFIKNWALSKMGTKVQRCRGGTCSTECWDLAYMATVAAKAAGFGLGYGSIGNYEWSDRQIDYTKAKAGDIVQLVSWREKFYKSKYAYSTSSTGPHHTAIVVEDYDATKNDGGLVCVGQNPSPVSESIYHNNPTSPSAHTGGTMIVFSMHDTANRLRLFEKPEMDQSAYDRRADQVRDDFQSEAAHLVHDRLGMAGAAVFVTFVVAWLGLVIRRRGSNAQLHETYKPVSEELEMATETLE